MGYKIVRRCIENARHVKRNNRLVLLVLAEHAKTNSDGYAWCRIGRALLSDETGIGEESLRKIIRRLEAQGVVEMHHKGGQSAAPWYLIKPEGRPVEAKESASIPDFNPPLSSPQLSQGESTLTPHFLPPPDGFNPPLSAAPLSSNEPSKERIEPSIIEEERVVTVTPARGETPVSSSVSKIQIPLELAPVTLAVCERTKTNPNDMGTSRHEQIARTVKRLVELEPRLSLDELAAETRRRFADALRPPQFKNAWNPSQLPEWWHIMGERADAAEVPLSRAERLEAKQRAERGNRPSHAERLGFGASVTH